MTRSRARTLAAWLVAAAGLAGASVGLTSCGSIACFEWDGSQGDCPDRAEASQIFLGVPLGSTASPCGSEILSVDGDPSYDGELCCYGVTYRRPNDVPCYYF